ncbi:MAG: sugar phosphate isomerase/epimerase, partial [Anaerolineae bacterium]|nr:sugar phosphate isomerase/epimerase [Anaerolineae bacterium]
MKLGANTVLFGGYDMETAFKYIAMAGYDGVEVSALTGMSDHLDVTRWREQADEVKRLAEMYDLEILAMELGRLDRDILELAFQAANAIDCPIVNCGPGGKANDEESFQQQMAIMRDRAKLAEEYGVTLCVKAHVRASVWNTPTTLRMIESVPSPFFGVDMDPSHLWRGGEEPADSVEAVIDHIKH